MMVSIKTARPQPMNVDVADYALPPDIFTLVRNARPVPGSIKRGQVLMVANPGITTVPSTSIGMLVTRISPTVPLYYFGYAASIQFYGQSGLEDITRSSGGAYTGGAGNRWSFVKFNEYIVATNNVDVPQSAIISNSSHADMAALTNYPASTLCRVLFAYKNFLVTANVSKSGTRYPRLVKWSHPAASGLPSSWDETDPTLDAGEVVLGDGDAPIVCAAPFQDFYVIYTEQETWAMRFVGGQFIFDFKRILTDVGALNTVCAVALDVSRHAVFTYDLDLVVHDGNSAQSVTTAQVRAYIKQYMYDWVELMHDGYNEEVWVCHPSVNSQAYYDKALVYNYRYQTWALHELPSVWSTGYGFVNHPYAGRNQAGFLNSPVLHGAVSGNSRLMFPSASSVTEEGRSTFTMRIERTGLSVKGAAQDGSPVVDYDTVAMFQEFRPRFRGTAGDTVSISFGSRQWASESVSFGSPQTFTIGTSQFLSVYLVGRLLDIRMDYTHASHDLTLEGYDLDVVPLARH